MADKTIHVLGLIPSLENYYFRLRNSRTAVIVETVPLSFGETQDNYAGTITDTNLGEFVFEVVIGTDPAIPDATGSLTITDDHDFYVVFDGHLGITTNSAETGSGARTVTVTVDDGANALQAANVRLTEGSTTVQQQTDVNGQVTFNVDDASYLAAITKPGFTFSGATLVVSGDVQQTFSMTQTTVVPVPAAGQAVGQMLVVDETGEPESGVEINVQMVAVPTDTTGNAFDSKVWTQTSDGSGQVLFDGLIHGAVYQVWRGCSKHATVEFEVPEQVTFNLSDVLG